MGAATPDTFKKLRSEAEKVHKNNQDYLAKKTPDGFINLQLKDDANVRLEQTYICIGRLEQAIKGLDRLSNKKKNYQSLLDKLKDDVPALKQIQPKASPPNKY